jgi:hypothetical protein
LSPRTKLVVFVLCIGVILSSVFYLMDVQFGFGYYSLRGWTWIVLATALILYFLLTRIVEKLKKKENGLYSSLS